MITPENRAGHKIDPGTIFEISALQARSKAFAFASKNNSNVGLRHLYNGVHAEMGDFLVRSDLQRKNIDLNQLRQDIAYLENFGGDGAKPPVQLKPRQSSYVFAIMEHSVKLAASRKNPMTQRPSARDLLVSIAVVASQEATSLKGKLYLAEVRSRHPLKIYNPEKLYLPIAKEINLIKINNLPRC